MHEYLHGNFHEETIHKYAHEILLLQAVGNVKEKTVYS